MNGLKALGGTMGLLAMLLVPISAWLTHIVSCLMAGAYVLLLAGALVPPVGVIHGIGIWFGIPWYG